MKKILLVILTLILLRGNSFAQNDTSNTSKDTNKVDSKNIELIQKNPKSIRLNSQKMYDAHWCTLGGIVVGGGVGYTIGYFDSKKKPVGIFGPYAVPFVFSIIGGIIGCFAGYIIDELVLPDLLYQSKTARITIRGNSITVSCTL